MRETLDQLLALQEIDTAIREAETAKGALDDGTAAAAELAELEQVLEDARHSLEEVSSELKDQELALATVEEKKRLAEKHAYSGTVSNPRELEGLEKDISQLGRRKDRLETAILELYDLAEERTAAADEQARLIEEAQSRLAQIHGEYAERRSKLNARLGELNGKREELAPAVDAAALKRYEAIRERAANVGIAIVDNGVCGGCNVTVPSTTLKRLALTTALLTCDSCGRILYPGKGQRNARARE